MNIINENLKSVHDRIEKACALSNRYASDIKLLLATKTVAPERIKIALESGEALIGENKVQELRDKYEELRDFDLNIEKHFIGYLQTNKIKDVLKYVTCVQSVDRIDLVQKLDKRLLYEGRSLDILIQVNTSYEESKFGVSPEGVIDLIKNTSHYDTLKIKGLMTIGLLSSDKESVRKCFRLLKNIQKQVIEENIKGVDMSVLSMGMSGDFETAIEEGATILRVGSAVFGNRVYPNDYWDNHL